MLAAIPLAFILLGSLAYAPDLRPQQGDATGKAAKEGKQNGSQASIQALTWPRSDMPQGVDLFAFIGMKSDSRQKFYELSSFDRGLYRNIFTAQSKGDWRQANALMKRLQDPILIGHVLYERYIHADDYKASYEELRKWMVNYGDHPNAYKVYQLAQKRRNNNPAALPAPQMAKKFFGSLELSWLVKETSQPPLARKPNNRNEGDVRQLMRDIKTHLAKDRVTSAYNLLGKSPASNMLSAVEYDSLLGEIAAQYYYNGKTETALKLSQAAIKRSGKSIPVAFWIAGLSEWRNENYAHAAKLFEMIPQSASRNPWMVSAGAFWAARAYDKVGNDGSANDWLQEAASYPRTFYGQVAKARLGKSDNNMSWAAPRLSSSLVDAIRMQSSGRRALALLDINRADVAQKELLQIHPNGNHRLEKALISAAHHFKLPEMALRLGNAVNQPDGKLYDVALYPMVPWKGDMSTGIDPALINALIRQESKFDPQANNARSGARGLMQLMPSTAQFMSDSDYDAKNIHDPEVNIALGQRYIRYLLKMPQINGNLLYLAAAYNAGPGNLTRWQKTDDFGNDPFLFIESIPLSETRAFIERVMTNYWMYNQRLNQDMDTLQALGNDQWPQYRIDPAKGMQMASAALDN